MENERIKICPNCNKEFSCCIENCWCSKLPNVMPLPENAACYCPECLNVLVKEKVTKQ